MNPSHLDEQKNTAPQTELPGAGPRGKVGLWLDAVRCKITVRSWHRKKRKQDKRNNLSEWISKIPNANRIGDMLYAVGFLVEYQIVQLGRMLRSISFAIAHQVATLLLMVAHPFVMGLATLFEDLTRPFRQLYSGIRHIAELSQDFPQVDARALRKEKIRYFFRGIRLYFPLVLTAVSYALPIVACVGLYNVVQTVMGYQFVLNVQVDGVSVGYVESEQVFESASEDVRSRINNARAVMAASGNEVPETQWDIDPTYTLAIGGDTMTESEVANAILRAASDEIGEGTAVYIDGALRFVTTEGDHLRTYLESVKRPFENNLDPNIKVNFVHDIELVDGVYLLSSIVPYDAVIAGLGEGGGARTYRTEEGETGYTVMEHTQLDWDTLVALNPDLQDPADVLPSRMQLITGLTSPELLKVKVVERRTRQEEIPYEEVQSESSEYNFGDTVLVQEGENGLQEITEDYTYIDGVNTEVNVVRVDVIKQPVTRETVKGTRLASGMVGYIGSGSFIWPVPKYTYVSRWMSSYHKGADICAPYGTPIYASDAGVVQVAAPHYSYGNYIIIDHGNGFKTLYGHMSSFAEGMAAGVTVKQGDVIGYVGSTGNSTGNHCHFEMYQNGVLFSAQSLFPGR